MIKYFLKIVIRFLWRNKTYSGLNYACLTFGFTCAIIASLYILNIFDYDKFHSNYRRLYSVEAYVTFFNGDRFPKEYLTASLPDMLKKHAPEIEEVVRMTERSYSFVHEDKTYAGNGFYADNNFFDVFSFPVIYGNSRDILNDINSIVISESMALNFFENADCTGKILVMNNGSNREAYRISGIFRQVPNQSLLQFDFIIPFSKFLTGNAWALETGATANTTWIMLRSAADWRQVNEKIKNLIVNHESSLNHELFLFPLKDKILYRYADGKRVWSGMQNVMIVGAVGLVILLIACFNFINLAIAINIRRYREAGIKKVVGSKKAFIISQFLSETSIIILAGMVSAIVLVALLPDNFNLILNSNIHLGALSSKIIAYFLMIALFTGLISGLIPALYLASSNPISVLKGKIITSHSYSIFRQSLIVFQFTIPIALIICMLIIKTQDRYMREYDAGVDKDKVIVVENISEIPDKTGRLKADLLAIPGIEGVSYTNCIPTRNARVSNEVSWEGKDASEKLHFWCINSDFDYNQVVKIKMMEGRFFSPSFSSDSDCYVINDVAARVMRYTNPVGASLTLEGNKGTIIGIIKDFHAIDLAGPLVPVIMRIKSEERPIVMIRFSSGNYASVKEQILKVLKHHNPDASFEPALFQDLPANSNLSLPSNLIGLSFIIGLLLGCMGLFGLASFSCERRIKEIGIRKTNGATTLSIMGLLLTSYLKWLVIAFILALPVAFTLGQYFLSRFFFHAAMPVWAFLAGPAFAILVAILTVSFRTWGVASRNPVEALRYE